MPQRQRTVPCLTTEEEIPYETYLGEAEITEIIKAIEEGQSPSTTRVINDIIEGLASGRSEESWNETDDATADPYFTDYYDYYNEDDENQHDLPVWPETIRNITVADSWEDVISDIDEFLEEAFQAANSAINNTVLQLFSKIQGYNTTISDLSRFLQFKLPEDKKEEYKPLLTAKALNNILVEEGLLYNKKDGSGKGLTQDGEMYGLYSFIVPSNGDKAEYEKICYTREGVESVFTMVCEKYPSLFRYDNNTLLTNETNKDTITQQEETESSQVHQSDVLPKSQFDNSFYLTHACYVTTVKKFREISLEQWLSNMKANYQNVTPKDLTEAQIRAWEDEFNVLQDYLPVEYDDLSMIFEYVMPANRPRGEEPDLNDIMRPDLIILSSDTVGIFEFKQRDNDDRYTIKPAKKYRKSIRRYHCNSIGMRKKAALVLTTRNGYISRHNRLISCSPDMLPQVMDEYFKEHNTPHPSPEAWMKSEFGLR